MYQLKFCVWELTRACTMNCIHCGSQAGTERTGELDEEEAIGIADQLLELNCEQVALIGGEVTLCSYWSRLARYFSDHGVICDVVTNGYRKSEQDYLDFAESHIRSAAVSVDGMEELHNMIRGRTDAFREADRFCRRIVEMGIPLTAVTTITRYSIPLLEELYLWLKERRVSAWQWQQVSPMGNAKKLRSFTLERKDIEEVFDKYMFLQAHQDEIPIILADNLGYHVEREGRILQPFHGCAAGLSVIGLDSVGNVRGCESLYDDSFIEGNLRECSLRAIWESSDNFSYNRRFNPGLLSGKCLYCDKGTICAGGCRSFNAFHGVLYENFNCIKQGE